MTAKRYLGDGALAGVIEVTDLIAGERPVARFRETWFHPQGGGQRADRGWVGAVAVVDVRHGLDGMVDHVVASLEGLSVGASYAFAVDADWRRFNSNLHSAGHLLAGVCETMFPGPRAVGGHHWPGEARVDVTGEGLDKVIEDAPALEEAVNREVRNGLAIRIIGDPHANRLTRIDGYAPIACGGTHAALTSELGTFKIRTAKKKGAVLRIGYDIA